MKALTSVPLFFSEDFFSEFVEKMRLAVDAYDKPSPRQSVHMHRLLLYRLMKEGRIKYEDLVEIATVTSRPRVQPLAERVAWDIIRYRNYPEGGARGAPTYSRNIIRQIEGIGDEPREENKPSVRPANRLETRIFDLLSQIGRGLGRGFSGKNTGGKPSKGEPSDVSEAWVDGNLDPAAIGLLPGLGEDKLMKMYLEALESGVGMRSGLREILKKRLMAIGREFEDISCLPRRVLRPFEDGEDPDLIDEERSLEQIFIDLGKTVEDVEYGDFLMMKRIMKPKTVIFLQDVSNSMYKEFYEKTRSIQYTVLALISLIHALPRVKYGLALFESDTHVLKDLAWTEGNGHLVDTLLYLATSPMDEIWKGFWRKRKRGQRFFGGTSPKAGLRWASERLEAVRDRSERFCFIFSDFAFEDPEASDEYQTIQNMARGGVRVFACVSPLAFDERLRGYVGPILTSLRRVGCEVLTTTGPRAYLQELRTVLERR